MRKSFAQMVAEALGGKLLKDMGCTNVRILKRATVAWKKAGYPTIQP